MPINIPKEPIVLRVIEQKTCATLIIANAVKLPFEVFHKVFLHSFMTRWANEFDSISVHPLDKNYDVVLNELADYTSFTKIEVKK